MAGHSLQRRASVSSFTPSAISRPSSSLSQRPTSRLSQRPASRLSIRHTARASTKLLAQCQALVTRITGLTSGGDEDAFRASLDNFSRKIDAITKQAVGLDMKTVLDQLKRRAKRARIQSRDTLAGAFELSYHRLEDAASKPNDLDEDIKVSKLPDHLQFLISLSMPADSRTLAFSESLLNSAANPPEESVRVTWKEILEEEPFEGQHWQGTFGLLPGSVLKDWESEESSVDSSPLLSPLNSSPALDDDNLSSTLSEESQGRPDDTEQDQSIDFTRRSLKLREELEALQQHQYWRSSWKTDADVTRGFDLNDASTLGPSFLRATHGFLANPSKEKYINECDAVREVLIALQGRRNTLLQEILDADDEITLHPSAPKLLHLTPLAQASILGSFARIATALAHLRRFRRSVFAEHLRTAAAPSSKSSKPRQPLTLEAFAEAVDRQICRCEMWCAQREQEIVRARMSSQTTLVVTLLDLERSITDNFSEVFTALLEIQRQYVAGERTVPSESSRAAQSTRLLDFILGSINARKAFGDLVTAAVLMQVFIQTVEPVWKMLGLWLSDSVLVLPLDATGHSGSVIAGPEEFFIESNSLRMNDPDFWTDGYAIRRNVLETSKTLVPIFLKPVAERILSAGKAIRFLRFLDRADLVTNLQGGVWDDAWAPFASLMGTIRSMSVNSDLNVGEAGQVDMNALMSSEDLALLIREWLSPSCLAAENALMDVLFTDCGFWENLQAIEELFLMRKGDIMSDIRFALFARMDSTQAWTDYHFLNTAFREVVDNTPGWINSSVVRLSYRGRRDLNIKTIASFSGLHVDYTTNFPLVYIFDTHASQVYNSVFILLLQLYRAKTRLDGIVVRRSSNQSRNESAEVKTLCATRVRLSWFVNTILSFVGTHVLQTGLDRFHEDAAEASSLDELVRLHRAHLDEVELRCLLKASTNALHRALLSILEMCLHFSNLYAMSREESSTLSTASLAARARRHRSRRLRRESRNIVSSEAASALDDSEASDTDLDESALSREEGEESFVSFASTSYAAEDVSQFNEKLSSELDGSVRFIRRGVQTLARGTGGSRFEELAFALEDWDL